MPLIGREFVFLRPADGTREFVFAGAEAGVWREALGAVVRPFVGADAAEALRLVKRWSGVVDLKLAGGKHARDCEYLSDSLSTYVFSRRAMDLMGCHLEKKGVALKCKSTHGERYIFIPVAQDDVIDYSQSDCDGLKTGGVLIGYVRVRGCKVNEWVLRDDAIVYVPKYLAGGVIMVERSLMDCIIADGLSGMSFNVEVEWP